MQPSLSITADWERLNEGAPEERACFASLAILANNQLLTEGHDGFVNRIRPGPLISAYHLAEWLAWNWWRLRWEPRSNATDWPFAHRLTTIGEGYVWPNITIFSDGERTALIAKPTAARPATAFRYISDQAAIVPSAVFESEVDRFIDQVLGQLQAERLDGTNLDRLWAELTDERRAPDTARRRKLEALLGKEPDTAAPADLEQLIRDAEDLGERAVEELAADVPQGGGLPSAAELRQLSETHGYRSSPKDAVCLAPRLLPGRTDVAAWRLGAEAAQALRQQEGLGDEALSASKLAQLAGVRAGALADTSTVSNLSFTLDTNVTNGRIVLRSRWKTGRRFELARLLADRLVAPLSGRLHVATRAYTYRQKMQRAFAAEFLSPFKAVDAMLDGDYSAEAQADAAAHFEVSDLTIRTLLVNHQRIERDELDEDVGHAA